MESKGSAAACRQGLARLMREKAPVIAEEIIERNRALGRERGEEAGADPEEVEKVVQAVLEHGFRAIEGRQDRHPPPEVVAHARELAWKSFRTHTVLRRYEAGAAVFKEHLRQARSCVTPYSAAGSDDAERAVECAFEQLQDRVESAHIEEEQEVKSSPETRKRKCVEQILSGKLLYPPDDLGYDFSATHIGVVGSGPGVEDEIKRLAKMLGGELLIVQASPDRFWAWIGLKLESSAVRLDDVPKGEWDPAVRMGIGEAAAGLPGWRHTRSQAQAAFNLTHGRRSPVLRYADVFLLACINQDDLPRAFLHKQILEPLERESDGGATLFSTLETYLAKDRQISSTAKALTLDRRTVRSRLDKIEARLGKTISAAVFEIEAALLLRQHDTL